MRRLLLLLTSLLLLGCQGSVELKIEQKTPSPPEIESKSAEESLAEAPLTAAVVLERRCVKCHQQGKAAEKLRLPAELTPAQAERLQKVVASGKMPPKTSPPLSAEQRKAILDWSQP